MKKKEEVREQGNDEIRAVMLRYFYDRNANATSIRGKKGASGTISSIRADLKAAHGLSAQKVVGNLTYLISQGWVEKDEVKREVATSGGRVVPSSTPYYVITAAGIDKIEGPGEFTRDPFHGIRVEATGQNIITVGDGNQVNATYKDIGEALSSLADAVRSCQALDEGQKLNYVADIQGMQSQLAKQQPNRSVLQTLWQGLRVLATIDGVASAAERARGLLAPLLGGV